MKRTFFINEDQFRQCQRRLHTNRQFRIVQGRDDKLEMKFQILLHANISLDLEKKERRTALSDHVSPCLVAVPKISNACTMHEGCELLGGRRTNNGSQIGLGTGELGGDELQDELFHVILDFGMTHDPRAECSGHVESTKLVNRRRISEGL